MADRQQGLINAMELVYSGICHLYCIRYVVTNLYASCKIEALIWLACDVSSEEELRKCLYNQSIFISRAFRVIYNCHVFIVRNINEQEAWFEAASLCRHSSSISCRHESIHMELKELLRVEDNTLALKFDIRIGCLLKSQRIPRILADSRVHWLYFILSYLCCGIFM